MIAASILIVVKDKKQIARAAISKDPFTIGRGQRCDLVLDDKQISREHVIISKTEQGCEIIDHDSRNGTTINGTPITTATLLKNGDKIGIGPFEIRFNTGPDILAQDQQDDATRFVGEAQIKGKIASDSRGKVSLVYRLEALSGPLKGNVYKNWEGDLILGRGLESQVVLPDDASSVKHAKIFLKDGTFYVEDFGSSNGTFVQGVRVQQERLNDGSKIRIGASTFIFRLIDVRRKKRGRLLMVLTAFFVILAVLLLDKYLPKDRASIALDQAHQLAAKGQYAEAEKKYKEALAIRPNAEASKNLKEIDKQIEVIGLLDQANAASEREDYGKAQDLCYQVLRIQPKNEKAASLIDVMKMIGEAQAALDARNWVGALDRIDKARETYPSSDLLSRLLEKAKTEQSIQADFDRAKGLMQDRQFMLARNVFSTIPETSVYHEEAQQFIQNIEKQLTFGEALEKARAFYREGNEAEARAEIEKGLSLFPEDADLLALKQKLETISPMAIQVKDAKRLLSSDDVDPIKQVLNTATKLMEAEQDPLNKFHADAMQAVEKLQARLKEIGDSFANEGDQQLQSGDRHAALKSFTKAVNVDSSNAAAKQKVAEITQKINEETQKFYRQGEAFEELGQKELAIDAYHKVLEAAMPEDVYYQKASEKLRKIK